MRNRFLAALLVPLAFILAITGAGTASAATYSYYYSGPVECSYPGDAYNYVLVRLTVQVYPDGHLDRAFQIAYGNALPAQPDNSEVITNVTLDEYNSSWVHVGHSYSENRPSDLGGWTQGMSTYYSPWLGSSTSAYEKAYMTNVHGDVCVAYFTFHR